MKHHRHRMNSNQVATFIQVNDWEMTKAERTAPHYRCRAVKAENQTELEPGGRAGVRACEAWPAHAAQQRLSLPSTIGSRISR